MEAFEIIEFIRTSQKKTPVRVTLQEKEPCEFSDCECFSGGNGLKILFGDWNVISPQLEKHAEKIASLHVENSARNSAIAPKASLFIAMPSFAADRPLFFTDRIIITAKSARIIAPI